MNIYGIEIFLIEAVVSSSIMTLFIYPGNWAVNFRAASPSPDFRQTIPTFQGKALKSTKLHRKIESKPTIGCIGSEQPIVRPEAHLS